MRAYMFVATITAYCMGIGLGLAHEAEDEYVGDCELIPVTWETVGCGGEDKEPPLARPVLYFNIVNEHSGQYLAVGGASHRDGANILQWENLGSLEQRWRLVPAGDGYFHIEARHSGKRMAVGNSCTVHGANVMQWKPLNLHDQQWRLVAMGGGCFKLLARHSGQTLAVGGATKARGGNVIQWPDNGGDEQRWRLILAEVVYECMAD